MVVFAQHAPVATFVLRQSVEATTTGNSPDLRHRADGRFLLLWWFVLPSLVVVMRVVGRMENCVVVELIDNSLPSAKGKDFSCSFVGTTDAGY